ncbi:membrane protein [Paenibacillus darwinianus]|uniref:Membrane protein n=1 Tax=Paenibacillus darwinianus TaxID=1380763 RepID=A0A9W5S435_9BACL|nr:DUF423 domain-containing protein [Paenibacillus darwinianus]EXX91673.1 membrane protein [Paenibacillus darwinianus]EXX91816.1 membrane protein [Paenibacillus darwinianus]EXX92428.1 membrane protein [Paenibacillus darwinianus]
MFPKQIAFGAVYAALAVALGAFGAHALDGRLTAKMLQTFETGVRYQMYHALGLLVVGVLAERAGGRRLVWAGRMLHAGIWLFSGSLYILSLTGVKVLGAITPLGGAAFIAGWLLVAAACWPKKRNAS